MDIDFVQQGINVAVGVLGGGLAIHQPKAKSFKVVLGIAFLGLYGFSLWISHTQLTRVRTEQQNTQRKLDTQINLSSKLDSGNRLMRDQIQGLQEQNSKLLDLAATQGDNVHSLQAQSERLLGQNVEQIALSKTLATHVQSLQGQNSDLLAQNEKQISLSGSLATQNKVLLDQVGVLTIQQQAMRQKIGAPVNYDVKAADAFGVSTGVAVEATVSQSSDSTQPLPK